MIPVYVNEQYKFQLAESWNELTGEQLIAISPMLLQDVVTLPERAYIAHVLCGFKSKFFKLRHFRAARGYEYFANEIYDKVLPRIEFLFTGNKLTTQLLPTIEVPGKYKFFGTTTLYGPASNFNDLTIAEFADCEYCLRKYADTKEEKWLNTLIGVLYRPCKRKAELAASDFDGDKRQAYNFYLNDFMTVMVSKLHPTVKKAILLWYMGCRTAITQQYSFLFTKPNEAKASTSSWSDVIHDMAGPKFGTLEDTSKVHLRVILKELALLYKKSQEA